MIRGEMVVSHPAARWVAQFVFWLVIVALVTVALPSCSTFGIATEEYVEDRVEAVNDRTASAAEKVAQSADVLMPGFSEYVGETFRNEPTRPPPPPDPAFPWIEVIGIVGAAFGVSVPAAVKATNMIRDNKRVARGEAVTPAEAAKKGYFQDGAAA